MVPVGRRPSPKARPAGLSTHHGHAEGSLCERAETRGDRGIRGIRHPEGRPGVNHRGGCFTEFFSYCMSYDIILYHVRWGEGRSLRFDMC